jgi:glutamine amidotransferase
MKAIVIDYGMGNLGSARRALEECGADVRISDDPNDLEEADRFVLPGVGAFPDAMACLRERGWVPKIHQALENPLVRMLGLCLGMQLMANGSDEGERSGGLGLIPGDVRRLDPSAG